MSGCLCSDGYTELGLSQRGNRGVIGWIQLSRKAVARAEQALNDQRLGVRDEIGFLALHQSFADRCEEKRQESCTSVLRARAMLEAHACPF